MKCNNCGSRLSESSNFCKKCGEPVIKEEDLKKIELTDNIDISQINMSSDKKEDELDKTIILPEIAELVKTKEPEKADLSENSIESEILKVAEGEIKEEKKSSKKEDKKAKKTSKKEEKKESKKNSKTKKEEEQIISDVNESTSSADIEIEDDIDKEFVELITEETVEKPIVVEKEVDSKASLENFMKNAKEEDLSKTTSIVSNMENNNSDKALIDEAIEIIKEKESEPVIVKEESSKDEIKIEQVIVRKNNPFIIFMLLISVLALLGTSIYIITNKDNKTKEEVKKEEPKKEETKKEDKYVIFKGYKIIINNYRSYNLTQKDLILYNDDYTIHTNIELDVSYDSIKDSKDSYKEKFEKNGYKVDSYGKKVEDGKEYIVFELSKSDTKTLLAYSKLSDGKTVNFVIENGNKIDYACLKYTNSIIDNTKKEMSYTSYDDDFYIRDK